MEFFRKLIEQDEINEQKGQNPNINKQAGENKSKQRGQILENNKQACSSIGYLRVLKVQQF